MFEIGGFNMRGVYRFNRRVALVLAGCILIPCVVILCVTAVLKTKDVYKSFDNEVQQVFDLINENAKEQSMNVSQKARFIVSYPELNDVLLEKSEVRITPEVLEYNRAINNVIDALFAENDATEVHIYTTNTNADYLTQVDYVEEHEFADMPEDRAGIWNLENSEFGQRLCFYRKYRVTPEYYNVIKITVPFRGIVNGFGSMKYKDAYVNINDVVFTYTSGNYSECELPYKLFHEIRGNIEPFDIEMTVCIDKMLIYMELAKLWLWLVLAFVVLALVVLIVSNVISNSIMKGVTDIVDGISLNNMDIIKKSAYKSRETDIIKNYLLELQDRLKSENEKMLKFESDLLMERISPHFLYNNLSAIKSNCIDEKSIQAIDRLVHYYRNVFQKGSQITTVKKEIENGIEYLQLMQFSYDCDFKIVVDIDNECENVNIPSNILQPILENAFIHGINNIVDAEGVISIKAYKEENDLFISVIDNGGKFDIERYKQRNSDTSKKHAIAMIAARMKLYYDDGKYTINISGNDDYTEVLFRFGTIS